MKAFWASMLAIVIIAVGAAVVLQQVSMSASDMTTTASVRLD